MEKIDHAFRLRGEMRYVLNGKFSPVPESFVFQQPRERRRTNADCRAAEELSARSGELVIDEDIHFPHSYSLLSTSSRLRTNVESAV